MSLCSLAFVSGSRGFVLMAENGAALTRKETEGRVEKLKAGIEDVKRKARGSCMYILEQLATFGVTDANSSQPQKQTLSMTSWNKYV